MVFLLLVAFDNTCYFIIVCYTNDFYWGCYHDEELPIISVVETQSFSFAKNSVESSTDQQSIQFKDQIRKSRGESLSLFWYLKQK
ncbi:unnamed protein product (macronuclear) [Paramecium tetraurelia]|uniref:Uncharacterized protein n=1 Tax=Paramecium tetraurelia TaxID=5888 RepID=A0C283_PARTE|nr:uncharacterized protein GSPATT00034377001 [Paramecium tetraurelia]CAK64900.1 unnamed protein product [Paramecium tetraurelia]|eukprot:XP_001432297.1 hypothetical protein (macronuclear) [Paramecium tetraurelia strain d4-2]